MAVDGKAANVVVKDIPASVLDDLRITPGTNGQALDLGNEDADGRTLFDTPQSEDGSLLVVFRQERFDAWKTQSLAHIESMDGKTYLAQVIRGPFAQPNGLPANSPLLRVTQVENTMFTPPYHGWVIMALLGEVEGDNLIVPLHRPRPNSKVRLLSIDKTREALNCEGDIRLGEAIGFTDISVGLESRSKHHMPRHTLVVGTTGAGKSTFVSSFIEELAGAGFCVLVIDVEPEYAEIHKPTESEGMKAVLAKRGLKPAGIQNSFLLVPTDCEAACPDHPRLRRFSLRFSNISPFLAMDLLQANDAQRDRFLASYDAAGELLTDLIPKSHQDAHKKALEDWDDQESGYPDLKLGHVLDMATAIKNAVAGDNTEARFLHDDGFRASLSELDAHAAKIKQKRKQDHLGSWRKTLGMIGALYRSKLFDREDLEKSDGTKIATSSGPRAPKPASKNLEASDGKKITTLDYQKMLAPGHVVILDMHGLESPHHRNLAISEILRGVLEAQDALYMTAPADKKPKTVIIIEEAHEFVSGRRLQQMPALSEQIHRTLCNNRILLKLGDEETIRRLKHSVGGVSDNLWSRLRNLPPGQAIVSAQGLDPAMLVSLKPGRCKLLMVD
jgi:uncharacterized protein